MSAIRGPVRRPTRVWGEQGFTLVELMVAMTLFVILGAIALTGVMALSRALDRSRATADLSAEARTALERMARELRQADADNSQIIMEPQRLRFAVDFNGNGTIDGSASDPEIITYSWDPTSPDPTIRASISLTATVPFETPTTLPLLAGHVSSLTFTYTSSNWRKDNSPADGTVTLAEAGVAGIDRVRIDLTVSGTGVSSQTFSTDVTMRNRSQA